METQTHLSTTVYSTEGDQKLDRAVNKLLADTQTEVPAEPGGDQDV